MLNIRTCQKGKLNGIMLSHSLLKGGRLLDENLMDDSAFKQKIVADFQNELCRFRQSILERIVLDLIRGEASPEESHGMYYLRGILGVDLGLVSINDLPSIDFNANVVSASLRCKSKQQFLDLFYEHYTTSAVIDKFVSMMNGVALSSGDPVIQEKLMLHVICKFIGEDAMDENDEDMLAYNPLLFLFNDKDKPIGILPLAAQDILVQLGFLNKQ